MTFVYYGHPVYCDVCGVQIETFTLANVGDSFTVTTKVTVAEDGVITRQVNTSLCMHCKEEWDERMGL